MLVSEQSLRTIRTCGDRVVVIDRGRSIFHGTAAEFLGDPEIARQYLMVSGRQGPYPIGIHGRAKP